MFMLLMSMVKFLYFLVSVLFIYIMFSDVFWIVGVDSSVIFEISFVY